jgi:hypothetical protein
VGVPGAGCSAPAGEIRPEVAGGSRPLEAQLRITCLHPAFIRTLTWTPQTGAETDRAAGERAAFHGGSTSLHLSERGAANVWLCTGRCAWCAAERWQVEIGDACEHLGFSLSAGGDALEARWRQLLKTCLP